MEAPFLPPHEPLDNPVAVQKKKRLPLYAWVPLIFLFFVLYEYFNVRSAAQAETSLFVHIVNFFWDALSLGWPFAIIGLFIFYFWHQFRGSAQFQRAQEPGLLALAEGNFDAAADAFRQVMTRYRKQISYASAARYSLAMVLEKKGDLEGALRELIGVETGAGLLYGAEIRLMAAIQLAQCYALQGQLDAARRWVEESRKRLGRGNHRTHSGAQLRIAESILGCREGKFEEALRGLERDWRQLEGNVAVSLMRSAWLMRGYALSQLGGVRGEGAATPWLMLLRGAPLDHLAVAWPELRTFLVANSLSSAA